MPTVLNGQFKFQPSGIDTGFVSVWFLQNGVEVGRGRLDFSHATPAWTEFTVNIDFDLGAAPDSMHIMFSSSNAESNVPAGTVLEIDAISFQDFVSVSEWQKQGLKCYPNPAENDIHIQLEETTSGEVQLINSLGMVVTNVNFQGNTVVLNNLDLPEGMYQLVVHTEDKIFNQQVVIH